MCLFIPTAVKQDKQHHWIQILFLTYLINECATKWMAGQTNEQKPQIWTCWEHTKPPTATANLLLASFHSGSHLCLSGMPISLACWPHYSPTLQLLNPQPALEKPPPKKHMPIYFCFTLFNIRDEENVFLCNYLIYLDLEYIKAVGGTVKKKRNLQIREISAMFKELNTQ